jgi:hypothetical protein
MTYLLWQRWIKDFEDTEGFLPRTAVQTLLSLDNAQIGVIQNAAAKDCDALSRCRHNVVQHPNGLVEGRDPALPFSSASGLA